jgi:CNT family concentrative nucleoside transporter
MGCIAHGGTSIVQTELRWPRLQLAVACPSLWRNKNLHKTVCVRTSSQELPSCSVPTMADLSREHNSSPMPGVHANPDPALDVANEHHHAHKNHTAFAEKGRTDNVVYTTGTTPERGTVPHAIHPDELHHRHAHADHDVEKSGAYYGAEKSSLDRRELSPHSDEDETRDERLKAQMGLFYFLVTIWRRWGRIITHVFFGTLMTG